MFTTQKLINEFMRLAEQKIPDNPAISPEDVRILRLRLIGEELLELADAFGCSVSVTNAADGRIPAHVHVWPNPNSQRDLVLAADAVADLMYVVEGTGSALGLDLEPIFVEVDTANKTKFVDGYKDAHGKWIKGPSHRPPDLRPIIMQQIADARIRAAQAAPMVVSAG